MMFGCENTFLCSKHWLMAVIALCLFSTGCVKYDYTAKPVDTDQHAESYVNRQLDDPGLREFMDEYGYATGEWPRKSWDLHGLTLAGYYFNPKIQVAIARHNKSLVNEEVAGIYPNPGIQIPFEHHSDTSGGVSPWLIGIVLDFVFERSAKREARVEHARTESDITKIEILKSAWQIYKSVRQSYLDFFVAVSIREFLQRKHEVVEEIVNILSRSYELGQTSEFELNTMRLELQKVRLELVNQDVLITDTLHKLAGEIGVPVSAINGVNLDFSEIDQYLDSDELNDLKLQKIALTHRLDMQQALSEYAAFEAALKLEIEKQYPDVNLSPGFVFDQNDNIWALGASWVLPLLHPQNEGPIKLALADRTIKQAEIISLQSGIINEIKLADSRLESTGIALEEAQLLMQEALERNRQMEKQYDLGQINTLVVLRNKLELLSIERALEEIEVNVINAAFDYEDVIQYPLLDIPGYQLNTDMKTNTPETNNENS